MRLSTGSQLKLAPFLDKIYIEIGACDFDNFDTYLDEGKVIFVEPIPEYRDSLRKKIGNHPNALFEECAISSYNGYMDMTYIQPDSASEQWVRGISHASFSSSNLINKNIEQGYNIGIPKNIKVPCITLDTLLYKYNIDEVEYLKIDVEGHELEIINKYSWRIKPKQLKIEHKFFDFRTLMRLLIKQGYAVLPAKDDLYAVLKLAHYG